MDPDRLCVVLVATRNPLNIGVAARAMANFGFPRLRLVHPYPLAFREARSAVGASDVLARAEEFSTVADAVADCTLVVGTTVVKHRHLHHPLQALQQAAPAILRELSAPPAAHPRVALLFGSEKVGLSNQDLSHCHSLLRIPTRAEQPSMNLGQAVAVCLYELAREGAAGERTVPHPAANTAPASGQDLERLTTVLLETLQESDSINAQSLDSKEEDLRRMIHRLALSTEDATTWLGILRPILWKLRTKN